MEEIKDTIGEGSKMKDGASSSSNPAAASAGADPPLPSFSTILDPANPQILLESAVAFLYDNSNLFADYSSAEMRYESIVAAVIEKKKQKGKAEMTSEPQAEQSQGTKRYKPQSELTDEASSPNPAAAAEYSPLVSFSEVMDPANPPRLLKSAVNFVRQTSSLHYEYCSLEMLDSMMYAVIKKNNKDKAERNEASSSNPAAAAADPLSFSGILDPVNPRPFLESAIQFLYDNSGSEVIKSMAVAVFEKSKKRSRPPEWELPGGRYYTAKQDVGIVIVHVTPPAKITRGQILCEVNGNRLTVAVEPKNEEAPPFPLVEGELFGNVFGFNWTFEEKDSTLTVRLGKMNEGEFWASLLKSKVPRLASSTEPGPTSDPTSADFKLTTPTTESPTKTASSEDSEETQE